MPKRSNQSTVDGKHQQLAKSWNRCKRQLAKWRSVTLELCGLASQLFRSFVLVCWSRLQQWKEDRKSPVCGVLGIVGLSAIRWWFEDLLTRIYDYWLSVNQ